MYKFESEGQKSNKRRSVAKSVPFVQEFLWARVLYCSGRNIVLQGRRERRVLAFLFEFGVHSLIFSTATPSTTRVNECSGEGETAMGMRDELGGKKGQGPSVMHMMDGWHLATDRRQTRDSGRGEASLAQHNGGKRRFCPQRDLVCGGCFVGKSTRLVLAAFSLVVWSKPPGQTESIHP